MRLKHTLGLVALLAVLTTALAASAPQLTGVSVSSKDATTTVSIRANGAFTHTEYRPADNLLLVDLSGVAAAKLDNQVKDLKGAHPGLVSYRVVGYKSASGADTTRVEMTLADNANVAVAENASGLDVRVTGREGDTPKPVAAKAAPKAKAEAAAHSAHPVVVRNVSISRGRNGLQVNISASGPIAPTAMKLTSPDRIVVDVPNAVPVANKKEIPVRDAAVKGVRMSRFQLDPPATRIVVDLNSAQEFALDQHGANAVLSLKAASTQTVASAAAGTPAPAMTAAPAVQSAVNTSVVMDPKITVRPATAEDMKLEGPSPAQPSASQRAADAASHFGSPLVEVPVTNATASMKPEAASAPYMIQAAAASSASASGACTGNKFNGEPISVNLKDVDLRDFFRMVHEISGLNVVLDPKVNGSLTMVLDDVPWDQALAIVMRNNGLDCQLDGNVLRIATLATMKQEADDRRAQVDAQALAVDLVTITRYLNYATSRDVVPTLKAFLSARGSAIADDRTNALMISDIPSRLPAVDKLIKELDRKTQQVEIEARVVAASRNFARDIGTQLGFAWLNASTNVGGSNLANSPFVTSNLPVPVLFSNLGAGGATNTGIGVSNAGSNYRLDFILTAAESRGLVKILSRPRIMAQDHQRSTVKQGARIPIVTQAQLGGPPTVQYVEAILRLTVRPQITAEGTIFLDVDVENTVPDFSRVTATNPNPVLNTQQAVTQVLVSDGGTVVIGGVIATNSSVSISQTPLLGSIPVFGNLFKRRSVSNTSQELIFFLTPKIIQT